MHVSWSCSHANIMVAWGVPRCPEKRHFSWTPGNADLGPPDPHEHGSPMRTCHAHAMGQKLEVARPNCARAAFPCTREPACRMPWRPAPAEKKVSITARILYIPLYVLECLCRVSQHESCCETRSIPPCADLGHMRACAQTA